MLLSDLYETNIYAKIMEFLYGKCIIGTEY